MVNKTDNKAKRGNLLFITTVIGLVILGAVATLVTLKIFPIKWVERVTTLSEEADRCLSIPHTRYYYESSIDRGGGRVDISHCHTLDVTIW